MAVLQVDPSKVTVIPANTNSRNYIEKTNLRVCAYARVSTDNEDQMTSYQSQIVHYTNHIKENKNWIFSGMFADEGITGTSVKNRKAFKEMISECSKGKIDLIITKSVSRFSRNVLDCLHYVKLLVKAGTHVVFEKESIDTRKDDYELLLGIMATLAQAESQSTSQNIKSGKRNAYKQGIYTFPNTMYGYRVVDKKPIIIEDESTVIKRIFTDYIKGMTLTQIAQSLNKSNIPTKTKGNWKKDRIDRILKNEKYKGCIILQKTYTDNMFDKKAKINNGELPKYIISNAHDPIITEKMFDTVQTLIKKRNGRKDYLGATKTGTHKYSGKYALTGKVFCSDCGSEYRRTTWRRNRNGKETTTIVWKCKKRHQKLSYCPESFIIKEDELHKKILDAVKSYTTTEIDLAEILENNINTVLGSNDNSKIEMQIFEESQKYQDIIVFLGNNKNLSIEERREYFKTTESSFNKIAELREKQELIVEQENTKMEESHLQFIEEELAMLQNLPTEYDDSITRSLISNITIVSEEKIKVNFINGFKCEV